MVTAPARRLAGLTLLALALAVPAAARAASPEAGRYACTHPPPQHFSAPGLQLTPVAMIGQITGIVHAPGQPNRIYVSERGGRVDIVEDGQVRPFLDLSPEITPTVDLAGNERGMQSIAFAPDYAKSRRFYVFYSDGDGNSRVDEFKAAPDFQSADPQSRRNILFVQHAFASRHYGGQLQFGPGGRLFVSFGDAERANFAQRHRFYGDLVSLDPARPKKSLRVLAKGFRNPYHFAFDPYTGSLVVGDVGEATTEEIDVLRRKRWGRANFGWPYFEGRRRVYPGHPKHAVWPVLTYSHKVGSAIMGGLIVRDKRLPSLRGRYVYADFCNGWLALARLHRKHPTTSRSGLSLYAPTAFGEDAAHEVYVASSSGWVYRLDPSAPSSPSGM